MSFEIIEFQIGLLKVKSIIDRSFVNLIWND